MGDWISSNPLAFTVLAFPIVCTLCVLASAKFITHTVAKVFKKMEDHDAEYMAKLTAPIEKRPPS